MRPVSPTCHTGGSMYEIHHREYEIVLYDI
jgi:hypothetical protein